MKKHRWALVVITGEERFASTYETKPQARAALVAWFAKRGETVATEEEGMECLAAFDYVAIVRTRKGIR